jgi:hypothetical protein
MSYDPWNETWCDEQERRIADNRCICGSAKEVGESMCERCERAWHREQLRLNFPYGYNR